MMVTMAPPRVTPRERVPAEREPRTLWMALDWIEAHCVVPDGFRKGEPFKLYTYQLLYLANFYLVRGDVEYDAAHPILGPAFAYRRGLLVGPQKVGKNPLIASQVCLEGAGPALFAGWAGNDDGYVCRDFGCRCGWERPYQPGDPMGMPWPTPLIQITAFSQESTDNTYDALRPMIENGPLSALVRAGMDFMHLPGGGRIDTVTSSAQSRLGQRVTFVPQDEVGIWTAINRMMKLADTQYRGLSGMGGRASLSSNSWDPSEHSVAQREYESPSTDVYRQFTQPPKNLSYTDKRDRRKIHRLVYPPDVLRENGGHLDLDSIEAEAADLVEKDAAQAARFYGNMVIAGAGLAVDPEMFDALAKPAGMPPTGTRIGAGFDGSISEDATVLRGCTVEGYRFTIGTWVRPVGDAMVRWQAANPGQDWRVPRSEVNDKVAWMFGAYDVGRFLCDPPKWSTEVDVWAAKFGVLVVLAFDTFVSTRFAPAVDRWRTAIHEGAYSHDGDPVVSDHIKAAHLKKVRLADAEGDGRAMHVIVKGEDRRKIDGAVADILASEAVFAMPAVSAKAVDRRMRVWRG